MRTLFSHVVKGMRATHDRVNEMAEDRLHTVNPPRNLTSGSPRDSAPPTPEAMLISVRGRESNILSTGLRAATNIASWGAGSEMDDAKKPEVKFLGGW